MAHRTSWWKAKPLGMIKTVPTMFNKPKFKDFAYEPREPISELTSFHLQSTCPGCQWEPPYDMPDDMYVIGDDKEPVKILSNYWVRTKNDDGSYEENKKVTKRVKAKIYPVRCKGKNNSDGGQDWEETHCCPVHGEWSFWNGYP